jgi:hypothetical protein
MSRVLYGLFEIKALGQWHRGFLNERLGVDKPSRGLMRFLGCLRRTGSYRVQFVLIRFLPLLATCATRQQTAKAMGTVFWFNWRSGG